MENVHHLDTARDCTARLEAAGWKAKERLGKRIWQSPINGCWYSEEMVLEVADRLRSEGNGEAGKKERYVRRV